MRFLCWECAAHVNAARFQQESVHQVRLGGCRVFTMEQEYENRNPTRPLSVTAQWIRIKRNGNLARLCERISHVWRGIREVCFLDQQDTGHPQWLRDRYRQATLGKKFGVKLIWLCVHTASRTMTGRKTNEFRHYNMPLRDVRNLE